MAQAPVVQVAGLRALVKDMKALGAPAGPLLKQMQQAAKSAGEPVAAMTRATLPQVSGQLAGTVRVTATRTGASVRMGSSSIRYAGWIEFGGTRRAPHESMRDYQSNGRYLFLAARAEVGQVTALYEAAVTKALNAYRWSNEETTNGGSVHD
jgi:hypothetical protein